MLSIDIESAVQRTGDYALSRNFSGFDPYDALNSPIVRTLSLGSVYGRIAWTQLFRRLPLNLRSVLLTPKGHNPKGLGLFLWGYAKLSQLDDSYRDEISKLLRLLASKLP